MTPPATPCRVCGRRATILAPGGRYYCKPHARAAGVLTYTASPTRPAEHRTRAVRRRG